MFELLAANLPTVLTTFAAIVASWIAYKEKRANTQDEHARTLLDRLMTRTKELEQSVGTVQNDIYVARKEAIEERRLLIADYEARIDKLIGEMRRAKDDMVIEISTWRDKYYTLLDDYHKLRLQHNAIEIKLKALEQEYLTLKEKANDNI